MGLFDFLLTAKQKKEKVATRIGLESGAFQECPVCRDVTEAGAYANYADKVAAIVDQRLILPADDDMKLFQGNREELLRSVSEVAEKLPYHCSCGDSG
ncbi:MAG: hypothetical protein HKP55_09750 [Gammaproteobacteria bacterium]|nr:hypothetical protein [Gammaproteobacteria bacterium]